MPRSLRSRLRSIGVRLPLSVSLVLLAVGAVFAWAAYREVRNQALEATLLRLENVSERLASVVSQGFDSLVATAQGVADLPVIRQAVAGDAERAPAQAITVLDRLRETSPRVLGVSLWNEAGHVVLESRRTPEEGESDWAGTPPPPSGASVPAVLRIASDGERVWYDGMGVVTSGERVLGQVLVSWELAPDGAEQLQDLVGFGASFALGIPGGEWTDFDRIIEQPVPASGSMGPLEYGPRGSATLAYGRRIGATSWQLWIQSPRRFSLAGPRAFLVRVCLVGLGIVLLGVVAAWVVSRRVTSRLQRLTEAANEVAEGRYDWELPVEVDDEIGRVARAFNIMARRVGGSHRQLEERVAQRAADDQRKNEFLATLAHELRNPLAPLGTGLHLIELADDDPDERRRAREMMSRQLRQLVRLIDDLLDVARISNSKLRLRKEPVELSRVIEGALEAARPFLDEAGHELVVDSPETPIWLEADPARLTQVLVNLLHNAAKFTPAGGRVSLEVERDAGEVALHVRDTGIGISDAQRENLFQLFSQVTPALERSEGGLGIGLALVRAVVEMHGGSVEASSDGPGRGSTFTVRLLVSEEVSRRLVPEPATERRSAGRPECRILVADDNRDCADGLSAVLELSGYQVRTAYDGLEALEIAARFRPHVVVFDIGMPGINGYEAARRLRSEPWGEDVLLVAVTGWGQDEDRRRAREAGFDHHLTKPVDSAELEKLLPKTGAARTSRSLAG